MILLHNEEVELSRMLLATMPEGVEVVQGDGGYGVSAYPSVVVEVPAHGLDRPLFGEDGTFLGMERAAVPAHQEAIRMPASWEAVQSFVSSVEDRARLNPVPAQ